MPGPLACLLVTPISPQQPGNGLAHRCRFWQRTLAELGPVHTVVVPVSGPAFPGDDVVDLPTIAAGGPHLPSRARWAPEHLGRAWLTSAAARQVDVVLGLRADVAGFALGAGTVNGSFVAIDLDDDDVELTTSLGQVNEASRYGTLIAELEARADVLLSATGFGATAEVPNSIDLAGWHDREPRTGPSSRILMVGNFTYEPNIRGADWFISEVLPLVSATVPTADLTLAGFGSERFQDHGIGFAPDLHEHYRDAGVVVVPLLQSSGTRIKALEAFAAGVPVVGTTVGLRGLPLTTGEHCLIADDAVTFADAVARLLSDRSTGEALAAAARSLVGGFETGSVVSAAVEILRAAIAARRPGRFGRAPDLLVTEEPDGLVVVDERSMTAHHLNELAAAVFLIAETPQTRAAIAAEFADAVELPPSEISDQVDAAISTLVRAGLLLTSHEPEAD